MPTTDPDPRPDPTEDLLRRTLAGAAAATTLSEDRPADRLVGDAIEAHSKARTRRTNQVRWLAAAAALVALVGTVGVVARGGGPDGRTESGPASDATQVTGTSGGPAPTGDTTYESIAPAPSRPEGDLWAPVLSFGHLPSGAAVSKPAAFAFASPPGSPPKGNIAYTQTITVGSSLHLQVQVAPWKQPPTPAEVATDRRVELVPAPADDPDVAPGLALDRYLEVDAGTGAGLDLDGYLAGSGTDPTYTSGPAAVVFGDRFVIQLVIDEIGAAPRAELVAVVRGLAVAGWQDLSGTPVVRGETPAPAPGSADIWPTTPPADYCAGWTELLRVQLTAPGPQSVQTEGFRRYTQQLEALAPGDLPETYRQLREKWLAPDKASNDDHADGSDLLFQHIHDVSTATCPGASTP